MVGPLSLEPAAAGSSFGGELALLLRLRLQSYLNAARAANPAHKWIGGILGIAAAALFAVILVVYSAVLLQVRNLVGATGLNALVAETVRYLFLFLVAGGVPFVSGVLFSPGDLALLAAAPIRPAAIVLARLFDSVVVASAQFIVIGVPLLVACAWALGTSPVGWIGFFLLLGAFLALPALLAAVLLLVFARLAGLRRVRIVVAATSAVFAVAICLLMVTALSRRSTSQGAAAASGTLSSLTGPAAMQTAIGNLQAPSPLMPSTWMTNSLLGLAGRGSGPGSVGAVELVGGTAVLAALCVVIGGPVLVGERLLEGESGGPGAGPSSLMEAVIGALPMPAPVRAIVGRDMLAALRDIVLLSQVGIPLILYLVPFVIGAQIGEGSQSSDMAGFSLAVVGTVAFMETSILSLSSIGLEGTGFWMVLSAPVTVPQLLGAKWVGAWCGSLALTLPLLCVTCLYYKLPFRVVEAALAILAASSACLCGFGVGLSGVFPRFIYDNPAHRASIAALIWGFVGSTLYVLLAGIPLGAALYLAPGTPEWATRMIGGGIVWFFVVSIVTAVVPLAMARARLTGYAWEA